jgi:tetratricopeptide (TPR) repeat protein
MNNPPNQNQLNQNQASQAQLKTDCHASREFLLESPIVPEHRVQYDPPGNAQTAQLKAAFPDMLTGEQFNTDSVGKLEETFIFGALAIKIDKSNSTTTARTDTENNTNADTNPEDHQTTDDRLVHLAKALDTVATKNKGSWGLLYADIVGLYIPGREFSDYQVIAQTIRDTADHLEGATLSIGIAGYPTDHFSRNQIMGNALKALDHATFLGPGTTVEFDAVSLNISGDRLYSRGDIKGSITEFEHALRLDPSNVNLRNSLGVCYGILKQYDQALSEFEAAIRLAPGEVMAVYNYGLVMMLTHHPNRALDNFLQAERVRDDIFEVIFHIGKVYLNQGHPKKGMDYFKKALDLNSNTSGVYRLMGQCHTQMKNEAKAVAAYTQAVRINDTDAEALSALGHLYDQRDENLEIATLFCERSIRIDPENGCYHHRLGRLYQKAERLDDALVSFENSKAHGYDSSSDLADLKALMGGESEENKESEQIQSMKIAR